MLEGIKFVPENNEDVVLNLVKDKVGDYKEIVQLSGLDGGVVKPILDKLINDKKIIYRQEIMGRHTLNRGQRLGYYMENASETKISTDVALPFTRPWQSGSSEVADKNDQWYYGQRMAPIWAAEAAARAREEALRNPQPFGYNGSAFAMSSGNISCGTSPSNCGSCAFVPANTGPSCGTCGGCVAGCCPHIYSWDGQQWHFDHDGYLYAILPNFVDESCERLANMKLINGKLNLRIEEELSEISRTNFVELYSVEYPISNAYMMMDYEGISHTIEKEIFPSKCVSNDGDDCLKYVSKFDNMFWKTKNMKNHMNWIELEFDKPVDVVKAKIALRAMSTGVRSYIWKNIMNDIGGNNLSILGKFFVAIKNTFDDRKKGLYVEIWQNGRWNIVNSPLISRERWTESLFVVDVSRIKEDKLKIRLRYYAGWFLINNIFVDYSIDDSMTVRNLELSSAIKSDGSSVINVLRNRDSSYVEMRQGDAINIIAEEKETIDDNNKKEYFIKIGGYYTSSLNDRSKWSFIKAFVTKVLPALYDREYCYKLTKQYMENPFLLAPFVREEYEKFDNRR